jgi:hypothetical protein
MPGTGMVEHITSVIRRYQDEVVDMPNVPKVEISNLHRAHHQGHSW